MSKLIIVIFFLVLKIVVKLLLNSKDIIFVGPSLLMSFGILFFFSYLHVEIKFILYIIFVDIFIHFNKFLYQKFKKVFLIGMYFYRVKNTCNICYEDTKCLMLRYEKRRSTCSKCNFVICFDCYMSLQKNNCPQCGIKNVV